MNRKIMLLFTVLLGIFLFTAVLIFPFVTKQNIDTPDTQSDSALYLKSYQNTVALYEGDTVKEIFSDVVLNALPIKDRNSLNSGILIESEEQLYSLLEDFDG